MGIDREIARFRSVSHAELFTSLVFKITDPNDQQTALLQRRNSKLKIASDYLDGAHNLNPNLDKAMQFAIDATSVPKPKILTKENAYWFAAAFSTYRLFWLRMSHFLVAAIAKAVLFRFFSVLSLSYFGELAYYLYHLCKESKNAMPETDHKGWEKIKNRVSAFFTCFNNAWHEDAQRRYKIKNAAMWGLVNLCAFILPLVFPPALVFTAIVIAANLIGFAFDIYNEVARRSHDVIIAEEVLDDIRDDQNILEPQLISVQKAIKDAKNKRKFEVALIAAIFVCMVLYFFPVVNIVAIVATAIIVTISAFFVLRNLWNLNKSIKNYCRQKKIELQSVEDEKTCTLKATAPTPTSTASVLASTDNGKTSPLSPPSGLTKPTLTRYSASFPFLDHSKEIIIIKSKSEGDLVSLPEKSDVEKNILILEEWIEKITTIITTNNTDNLPVILQNLTPNETEQLKKVLGVNSHQLWEKRLKCLMHTSNHSNSIFGSRTLLNTLKEQLAKTKASLTVLNKAKGSPSSISSHFSPV